MPFLRRAPLVRTEIDLYEGSRAAVTITPGAMRWPEHEGADRLVVPLGLAALALARASDSVIEAVRDRLRHAAGAIADPVLSGERASTLLVAVSGLEPAEPDGPGGVRVSAQLVRSAVGPIPTIGRASHGSTTLASAAAATLAVSLAPVGLELRLATAVHEHRKISPMAGGA